MRIFHEEKSIPNWLTVCTVYRKVLLGTVLLLLGSPVLSGQTAANVFSLEEFLTSVQLHHPISLQADLQTDRARAEMLMARGNLDPVLEADWAQKDFDDKLYYQTYQSKLRVPTVYGVDVVAGYEQTDGVFLNPEEQTDDLGLWHVGLEADLLQGLIVNERRIALDRAGVIQQLNENERQIALNDLLYEASTTYVDWQKFFYYEGVLDSNLILATTYFESTRISYDNGEYTAMDTLEAFILLQDALTELRKNDAKLIKAQQTMENYLWFDGTPLELQPGIIPSPFALGVPLVLVDPTVNLVATNPLIKYYLNKQEVYQIEQRLKRVKARPKLKVKYNALLATGEESLRPNFSSNDFRWGFDFSVPLLLRQARAQVQLGEIKIRENGLELLAKQNELNNKLRASIDQIDVLRDQVGITEANTVRYRTLLGLENTKFIYGESSVFLLNKRQEKYIEAQLKLIELKAQIRKELLNYRFLANDLIEGLPEN
ncbi:TolC family protein [Neolewinella antarctica]|uniref:Outer membrane protein TolC n=1 Tax=Neolewinella antarctica TaxID=442734 RepID=A0ABX0X8S6_9BACT|nr:TolC family protein [Neolewinella antarctica]NJC25430.1 outer membrane protein TolC [Neolewinella antarctica]